MLTAAIRDNGLVLFFGGMSLAHAVRAPVPGGNVRPHALPIARHIVEAARRVMASTRT